MYSVKQASQLFGIPKSTLYRYIRQRKLRTLKNPFGYGVIILEDEEPRLLELAKLYRAKREGGGV
ncbi:hypothetical protein TthSNM11_25400 (plasmid) [Thermus thermophilus]|uniref:helix-turn-helix domain-containing protein n=1 Tax=Thermus TaxID=270 RepID=UPI001565CFF7|nr:helix-turn-helix domain-containing protein [Thermus thermophilus]BDG20337.1 hypothetical protein TthSNM11_25400 [Thermus thermophilus]